MACVVLSYPFRAPPAFLGTKLLGIFSAGQIQFVRGKRDETLFKGRAWPGTGCVARNSRALSVKIFCTSEGKKRDETK